MKTHFFEKRIKKYLQPKLLFNSLLSFGSNCKHTNFSNSYVENIEPPATQLTPQQKLRLGLDNETEVQRLRRSVQADVRQRPCWL